MELEFKNLYIANVIFGIQANHKVVVAKDMSEALETLQEYYDQPEVNYIFSFEELSSLVNKFDNNLITYVVLEFILKQNTMHRQATEENLTLEQINRKYQGKNIALIDKKMVDSCANDSILFLYSKHNTALLSQSFTL